MELENDLRIYACGDTGLYSDMKLIGEYYKPDVAFVPISNWRCQAFLGNDEQKYGI